MLPNAVSRHVVHTARLRTSVLRSGADGGIPLVLIHGNVSSGRFYAEWMAELPRTVEAWAPDLRGYGLSEAKPIDATRGVRDFADDVWAFLDAVGLGTPERPVHVVGWSVGGGVVMQMTMDRPEGIASVTLQAPMSPFGFGGTKGIDGEPCHPDGAGAGAGLANPDFVRRLRENDASDDAPTSPRNIFRAFYVAPGFAIDAAVEDAYVESMLQMTVGDAVYPGTSNASEHWPMSAPGRTGVNNAISGKYANLSGFADVQPAPPVLWVRGANDQIVSDHSMFEAGALGQVGAIAGWPGDAVMPPQPMVSQTRQVLNRYAGPVREEVLDDCGHSPHLEHPVRFRELLLTHIGAV